MGQGRRVTRSLSKKIKIFENKNENGDHCSEFTSEIFQNQIFKLERSVRKAVGSKNAIFKELKKINNQLQDELKDAKIALAERDKQVIELESQKEDFKALTLAEVEKFDRVYNEKIFDLEKENKELKIKISIVSSHGKTRDNLKNEKLVKKYKEMKIAVKSKDLVILGKEKEIKDIWKYADEKVKLFEEKMNEAIKNSKDSDEEIRKRNIEIVNLKQDICKKEDTILQMKSQNENFTEELQKLRSDLESKKDLIKMKENALNDSEMKRADEYAKCITLQTSIGKHKETIDLLRKEFEKSLEEEKNKIKESQEKLSENATAIELLKRQADTSNDDNKKLKTQLISQAKEMEGTQRENEDLKKELEKYMAEKDKEVKEIKDKLHKAKDSLNIMKLKVEKHNSDLESKEEIIRLKEANMDKVESELSEEKAKCKLLQAENNRNEFIEEELKIKDKEIKELKVNLHYDDQAIEFMKKERNISNAKHKDMLKKVATIEKELVETKRGKEKALADIEDVLTEKDEKTKHFKEWNLLKSIQKKEPTPYQAIKAYCSLVGNMNIK